LSHRDKTPGQIGRTIITRTPSAVGRGAPLAVTSAFRTSTVGALRVRASGFPTARVDNGDGGRLSRLVGYASCGASMADGASFSLGMWIDRILIRALEAQACLIRLVVHRPRTSYALGWRSRLTQAHFAVRSSSRFNSDEVGSKGVLLLRSCVADRDVDSRSQKKKKTKGLWVQLSSASLRREAIPA
jgi:hypothetical protein